MEEVYELDGFSIIVPTYKRVKYLDALLKSVRVAIQHFDFPCEVLILDDSPEPEYSQIKSLTAEAGFRYINSPKSINSKRNLGIKTAIYPYILFLDSDCDPGPNILMEHWKSLHSGKNVGGCLGLLSFQGPDTWFWDAIELTSFVLPFYWPKFDKTVPWGPTANISYHKKALLEVGGFDETFPLRPGGEDVDLGLRVTKRGYTIVTNAEAVVHHTKETWMKPKLMMRRLYTWGRADYELYVRHKDRVFLQFPRLIMLSFLVILSGVLVSILLGNAWLLVMPIIWFLISLFIQAGLQDLRFRHDKPKNLLKQAVGIILTLCDEAGFTIRALESGDFKALFFKMRYTDGQQIGEWHYGCVRIWSASIAFFLITIILSVVK